MLTRLRVVTRALATDPRLLGDYARARRSARDLAHESAPTTPRDVVPLPRALESLAAGTEAWADGPAVEALRKDLPSRASGDHGLEGMTGDPALGELCYGVVRATRPGAVIETGVAAGMTSAFILAALADNGEGVLNSIDLPNPGHLVGKHVGELVPDELRPGWNYHWGSARRLLGRVLERTSAAGRRVFVHDSDHSYEHMRWELEAARQSLGSGDWIVADDVILNTAFEDFVAAAGLSALYVGQEEKAGHIGLVQLD